LHQLKFKCTICTKGVIMGFYMISALISVNSFFYGIDKKIAHGIVYTESRYKPNATGSIGEKGLFQVRKEYLAYPLDLYDPEINIHYGLSYLSRLKSRLHPKYKKKYVIAYNRGTTGLLRLVKKRGRIDLHKDRYYQRVVASNIRR
jgi:soluble lytic murein transglycosylase-like protein